MTSKSNPLDDLVEFLRRTRGVDFSGYKRGSLERRFEKRMGEVGVKDYTTYLDYLQVHPEEFPQLFNTILINVTAFFRDTETWSALESTILPPLLAQRGDGLVRAWSAGCASGEEPYTIAMMLAELLGEDEVIRRVKIYATDLDDEALRHARQGIYTQKSVDEIPPALLKKYFTRTADGTHFEFRKPLRRCVIFGRNDLVLDAPISRLDIIACRNTLMYLNAETQERILARFCFALNEGGVLVLGKAEMALTHATLFAPLDLRRHIFTPIKEASSIPLAPRNRAPREPMGGEGGYVPGVAYDAGDNPQLVVDPTGTLVLLNKKARDTFALGARDLGRPFKDLQLSYFPVNLRSMIDQVHTDGRVAELKNIERALPLPGFFDVKVEPLRSRSKMLGFQITFTDVTETSQLHRELRHANQAVETAHSELQSASEELETTNEELQSTIEELETTNEELQSTNEELETTNEELQSTNDELVSVNDTMTKRSSELTKLSHFLGAILSTLDAAVIVVDKDMVVQIWNKRAEELWGLRNEEVRGQSLMALDIGLPAERLKETIRACFSDESPQEVLIDGMNRRGKPLRCTVTCTRLDGDEAARGSVLLINAIETLPVATRANDG